ncbi:MAG: pyridoxal phosphate-dependent aminotransferase family protein [Melioribacteraceae bacterium]|nr:pyridoxal phosphate-dependent aminotransferase family protein [Melioribacteraceae bacterium]
MNTILEKFILNNSRSSTTIIDGNEYIYFGGTSYYELHRNDEVINSAINSLKKFGLSTSSSRSSFGNHQLIIDLEKEASDFFEVQDSVYLSSGFLSASTLIYYLNEKNSFDVIFIDEHSHYSGQLASKISSNKVIKFNHLDYNDLEEKIVEYSDSQKLKPLIITDGIFPIYGNIAPIDKYHDIAKKYNAIVYLDDSHGIGILGEKGKGTLEHFKIDNQNIFFSGTFSKAFGGYGGIIPINNNISNEIKNSSIVNGATPVPIPAISASLKGLQIFMNNPELKNKLWENAKYLKSKISELGIEVKINHVPIVAWNMKSKKELTKIQDYLIENKIILQSSNYIGAGENGVLRIVVFSTHTKEQIDYLIYTLKKII